MGKYDVIDTRQKPAEGETVTVEAVKKNLHAAVEMPLPESPSVELLIRVLHASAVCMELSRQQFEIEVLSKDGVDKAELERLDKKIKLADSRRDLVEGLLRKQLGNDHAPALGPEPVAPELSPVDAPRVEPPSVAQETVPTSPSALPEATKIEETISHIYEQATRSGAPLDQELNAAGIMLVRVDASGKADVEREYQKQFDTDRAAGKVDAPLRVASFEVGELVAITRPDAEVHRLNRRCLNLGKLERAAYWVSGTATATLSQGREHFALAERERQETWLGGGGPEQVTAKPKEKKYRALPPNMPAGLDVLPQSVDWDKKQCSYANLTAGEQVVCNVQFQNWEAKNPEKVGKWNVDGFCKWRQQTAAKEAKAWRGKQAKAPG